MRQMSVYIATRRVNVPKPPRCDRRGVAVAEHRIISVDRRRRHATHTADEAVARRSTVVGGHSSHRSAGNRNSLDQSSSARLWRKYSLKCVKKCVHDQSQASSLVHIRFEGKI